MKKKNDVSESTHESEDSALSVVMADDLFFEIGEFGERVFERRSQRGFYLKESSNDIRV